MGLDAEKCFAKMHKDGNMSYGVGIEMMKLKAVNIKKPAKEIRGGEGETPFGKFGKHDNFVNIFMGKTLTIERTPLDKTTILKKTVSDKAIEVVRGALTVSPVACNDCRFILISLLPALGSALLTRHLECHESLLSHALRGLRWKRQRRAGWMGKIERRMKDLLEP